MFGRNRSKTDGRPSVMARWWEGMSTRRRSVISMMYWLVIVGLFVTIGVMGIQRTLTAQAMETVRQWTPRTARVVLVDRPNSLPASLADRLCQDMLPADIAANDDELAHRVYQMAAAIPWTSRVHWVKVRPANEKSVAVVEVSAEFRMAVAVAFGEDGVRHYVDADGVVLPNEQVPKYLAMIAATGNEPAKQWLITDPSEAPAGCRVYSVHYIQIAGVAAAAPAPGQAWKGDDLAAGLRLLKLLIAKPYVNQIAEINVRNFDGRVDRKDPHLTIKAHVGDGPTTVVRFGRFCDPRGDWEIPPERKLYYLDRFVVDHGGRLAGSAVYVELRGDHLRYRPAT